MYERILVPLKQRAGDAVVVEHAGSLALLTGGSVTLMHVVHSHSRDEAVYLEDRARDYLSSWAERLTTRGVPSEARVVQGEPAEAITSLARDLDADLIVMATHGHSEVRHVFMGSVTEDVIRNGDAPVLLVQPRESGE
jgi:nucleotide-binding universal stress UspA family protein